MAVARLRGSSFFSLVVFADAAKRSNVSSTAEKKKREKKKKNFFEDTSLSPLSLSLSLSEEEDENKRSNKVVSSFSSSSFFAQKGRRGFSKGRQR